MAKIEGGPLHRSAWRALRGRVLIKSHPKGFYVAQKWPKGRGKAKSGYRLYRELEFAACARMAASPEPLAYQTAVEWAKGTEQVPRDVLMAIAMGTYYELYDGDGIALEAVRVSQPNPQLVLDMVGDTVGSILVRVPIGWVILPPGDPGQVLAVDEEGIPAWIDAPEPSGGAVKSSRLIRTTNQSTTGTGQQVARWEAADWDDLGIWDSSNPDRIYLPTGYSRLRLSAQAIFPNSGSARQHRFDFLTESTTSYLPGAPRFTAYISASFLTERIWSWTGPAFPPPSAEYTRLRVTSDPSATIGWNAGSAVLVEAWNG